MIMITSLGATSETHILEENEVPSYQKYGVSVNGLEEVTCQQSWYGWCFGNDDLIVYQILIKYCLSLKLNWRNQDRKESFSKESFLRSFLRRARARSEKKGIFAADAEIPWV